MLHIFKLNGHRAAYDCTNRVYYPLSSLAMKIIDEVTPPLTPECPSALRYSLAKYDSHDLADAYAEIYALYEKGLLFGDDSAKSDISAPVWAIIYTTGAAAGEKIESAAAAGFSHMIVLLKDASPCLVSSLREAYADKADIKLILETEPSVLSDADIETLNDAECYILFSAGEDFLSRVLALADRGARFIDTELPTTERGRKDIAKLAKEMEKRAKDGKAFSFAPFDLSLVAKEGFDPCKAACADCWAKEICGGFHLNDRGEKTPCCDSEVTAIECAVTLLAEADE